MMKSSYISNSLFKSSPLFGLSGLFLICIFSIGLVSAAQFEKIITPKPLILANDYVMFEFDGLNMGVKAIVDKKSGMNHIRVEQQKPLLWQLLLHYGTQENTVSNTSYRCTDSRIEQLPDGTQRAIMEWKDIRHYRENHMLNVVVTVDLPKNSGIAFWHLNVENNSELWGLWEIRFPMLSGFLQNNEYDIAVPRSNWGYLYKNANPATDRDDMYHRRDGSMSGKYPSHDWPIQMLSMTQDDNSIYVAALDGKARYKTFTCTPGKEFYISDFAEGMGVAGSDFLAPYPVALGVYTGNWWIACKMYREWALKQFWTSKGPNSSRKNSPSLLKNLGLWAQCGWEFGRETGTSTHEMDQPLLDAQKFCGVPMGLHWYNWHKNRFDNEYPYYPPKDGFKERVKELTDNGLLIMPYINGRLYDYDNPDYKQVNAFSSKDETGVPFMETYGTASGRMISMCPYTKYWQNKMTAVCDTLITLLGVNGVYIDQIGSAAPHFCFDPTHGHPIGSGSWWVEGYQVMLEKIQQVAHAQGKDAAITTENNAEPYMNVLDASLIWIKRDECEVPMMNAVYSGYTYYFASPHDLNVSDLSFVMCQGRDFLWGSQNGWMGLNLFSPQHAAKADYFKKVGQYRIAAKKFLSFGELLDDIHPTSRVETITENWPTHRGDPKNATLPCVMGSLWKAEDGHLGILITNFLNEKKSFSYCLDADKYGVNATKDQQYEITQVTPEKKEILDYHYSGPIIRTEDLGPREIRFLEIAVVGRK